MVSSLDDWPWSSFAFTVGASPSPDWFDPDVLLCQFVGARDIDRGSEQHAERHTEPPTERSAAIQAYRKFVMAGKGLPSPMLDVRHQLLLGDDAFVDCRKV